MKITILGDEGVPIQVDGEAWIQPPGVIKIQHKNRAQMLTRDRVRKREWGSAQSSGCESLEHEMLPEQGGWVLDKLHKNCMP